MKIISDTEIRVATDWGAIVMFYAGVEKEVSEEIGILALQLGAKEATGKAEAPAAAPVDAVEETAVEEKVEVSLESLLDRVVKICSDLIDEGNPDDFNLDGSPKAKIINDKAGEKVPAEIREQAWTLALNG